MFILSDNIVRCFYYNYYYYYYYIISLFTTTTTHYQAKVYGIYIYIY